jgi:hypothetical protein
VIPRATCESRSGSWRRAGALDDVARVRQWVFPPVSSRRDLIFSQVRFFKRKGDHHVTIVHIAEEARPGAFLSICSCGEAWPEDTKEEALRRAHRHGTSVSDEIEDRVEEEGGDGWLCLFCREVVGRVPLRVMVHWTDDGMNDEQWYAAHRKCFRQHVSTDDLFEPRFSAE